MPEQRATARACAISPASRAVNVFQPDFPLLSSFPLLPSKKKGKERERERKDETQLLLASYLSPSHTRPGKDLQNEQINR